MLNILIQFLTCFKHTIIIIRDNFLIGIKILVNCYPISTFNNNHTIRIHYSRKSPFHCRHTVVRHTESMKDFLSSVDLNY